MEELNLKKLKEIDTKRLTLMRNHLGLLSEDLADRFCISPALCSRTFTAGTRLLRQL